MEKKLFSLQRKNRTKDLLFNLVVAVLLLFVLISTISPLLGSIGVKILHGLENVKNNLSPQKMVAVNPLAPSFKDQVKEKVDPAIFEIKDFKEIDAYSLEATSFQGVVAVFGTHQSLDDQVSSLQTLLAKSRIEAKQVKKIDLRFNKTIVEYGDQK